MRLQRHPWDKWFTKSRFRIRRGRDYEGMTHAMSIQVRTAASKRGLKVSVAIEENADSLLVTVYPRTKKKGGKL